MLRFMVVLTLFCSLFFMQANTSSANAAFAAVGPTGYTLCAKQNRTCAFTGTASVAFGNAGHFNYQVATSKIACTIAVFKDPAPGAVKACYYKVIPHGGTRQATYFTSYGYNDNDDGNGNFGTAAIAYPDKHHPIATEGKGTYADPITFATDPREIPPHTMIYVPYLQKYFFMEDGCAECESDWSSGRKWRTDLFMGPNNAMQPEPALANCESKITRNAVMYIHAGPGYPVDVTPLFSTGQCTAHLH
jgi:hypothetical protein